MARPVKKRTGRSYARDVETLVRLRAAIQLDTTIGEGDTSKAAAQIDGLIETIGRLMNRRRKVA